MESKSPVCPCCGIVVPDELICPDCGDQAQWKVPCDKHGMNDCVFDLDLAIYRLGKMLEDIEAGANIYLDVEGRTVVFTPSATSFKLLVEALNASLEKYKGLKNE